MAKLDQEKASFPMEVTLSGISIEVRPHMKKAHSPIEVTLSGRLIEVKEQQKKVYGATPMIL